MEEDEIVISSWRRSDLENELKQSFGRRHESSLNDHGDASKENIDLNSWHSTEVRRNVKSGSFDSEDDEVKLDDDTLSRLIEGDLTQRSEYSESGKKPKPKPRQTGFSFANGADSADQLFSVKKTTENDEDERSPRPVPRPRSKPLSKDNSSGSVSNFESKLFDASRDPSGLSADKLFDSIGKVKKSVSFGSISQGEELSQQKAKKLDNAKHESKTGVKNGIEKVTNGVSATKEKTPPTKPARSRGKPAGSQKERGKGNNELGDDLRVQSCVQVPKRPPRLSPRQIDKKDPVPIGSNYQTMDESAKSKHHKPLGGPTNNRMDFNGLRIHKHNEDSSFDLPRENFGLNGQLSEERDMTRELEFNSPREDKRTIIGRTKYGNGNGILSGSGGGNDSERGFRQNGHESLVNTGRTSYIGAHKGFESHQKDFIREQDIGQRFEAHIPNTEGILPQKCERNKRPEGGLGGKPRKNTPLKADKPLTEMTKSPDGCDFQYESRDVPYRQTLGSKGDLSTKRSSSLTDLHSWRDTEFDDDEGSWESSRSGFESSRSIREAVFNEWLERKQKGQKEKTKKKLEEKKKEEEKEKEKQEKQLSAKKAFEVWSSRKEEVIQGQVKKNKEVKDKEIEAKREKILKQQDAKKFFESWKSKKDEILKETYREKRSKEKEAKQKVIEDQKEKIDIAKKSYEKWKARKDEKLKEEVKRKRKEDSIKVSYEKEYEMEKREESQKAFQEFIRKKGTGKRRPPRPDLTQRPWCPGGITRGTNRIPENVQPVIAAPALYRSRSFSGIMTRPRTRSFDGTRKGW